MKKSSKATPTNLTMQTTMQGASVEFTAHPCNVPKLGRKWETQMLKVKDDDERKDKRCCKDSQQRRWHFAKHNHILETLC